MWSHRRGPIVAAGITVVVALVAGMTPAHASPATQLPSDPQPSGEKIEPELQHRLQSAGTTAFWVRFTERADLSAATEIDDWEARGHEVADRLRDTATASQAAVRERLDSEQADYQSFWATNAIYVRNGSDRLASELAAHPDVASLHATTSYDPPELDESEAMRTLDSDVEWNVADVRADEVWQQYGVQGDGIVVANIDTGVQYDHPALVRQYRGNQGDGTFEHDYHWFDAAGQCPDAPCDSDGHGTHTMGTMVGDDGAENRIGVAPGVTWIAANGCCPTDAALITSGQWMLEPTDLDGENPDAAMRPHVINNSWGSEFPTNDPFMEDIALAWAASGIFGVWSNGNHGPACQTSGSPGSRTINYSVGAHDAAGDIANFSSRGAGQDGEIKPNIAAPGVDVRSSVPGGYTAAQGTSMAAPHVAGAVALLWSAAPTLLRDVDATRAQLAGAAIDTSDLQCGGTPEHNNVFGEGRLDALALLDSSPVQDTGTLRVEVTDADTDEPVSGAEVSFAGEVDRQRVTGDDGVASVALPAGEYTVEMSAFGYPDRGEQVTVIADETATQRFDVEPLPTVTVRGRVTDGSGHRWPLYAGLTVHGDPSGTVHTDPGRGRYELTVPVGGTYPLTVEVGYDGYQTVTQQLDVGQRHLLHNIAVPVDDERCVDIGYEYTYDGVREEFDAQVMPPGWEVVDHGGNGHGWAFDDPRGRGNDTGGEGGFAITDRATGGDGDLDSSLVTPVVDLTEHDAPVVSFRQDFQQLFAQARVELSLDAGQTWQVVLEQQDDQDGPHQEIIPIPQAAGEPQVQVRFRMSDNRFVSRYWQLDDVLVGTRNCAPVPGGLVLGHVRDRNTGEPLNDATVASDQDESVSVRSAATPDDPALEDGFFWTFSPFEGPARFTATADHYRPHTQTRAVGNSQITEHDFALPAGRLSTSGEVEVDVDEGGTATGTFTVTNDGTAPAEIELRERDSSYPIPGEGDAAGPAAQTIRVPGEFSPSAAGTVSVSQATGPASAAASQDGAWLDLPDYPTRVMDNAVGEHQGRIYSVGGMVDGIQLADGWVYDPVDEEWSPIAPLDEPLQSASGAFIDGKFYVVGGWEPLTQGTRTVRIYDPETDTWSTGADAPRIFASAGHAVLDGQLYVVGGCTNSCNLSRAMRYDPASDTWDELPRIPEGAAYMACGGVVDQVICTGGTRTGGIIYDHTFAYDPATDAWTEKADLPISLWGASYTTSSDRLLVANGVTGGRSGFTGPEEPTALTNEGFIYDPEADTWSSLPASGSPTHRAGSTCGLTRVGGSMVVGFVPVATAQLLPTFGDCVPADVSWLSLAQPAMSLAPGETATVQVTFDAAEVGPGSYRAGLWLRQDTPYLTYPVDVTMTVTPE